MVYSRLILQGKIWPGSIKRDLARSTVDRVLRGGICIAQLLWDGICMTQLLCGGVCMAQLLDTCLPSRICMICPALAQHLMTTNIGDTI